MIHAPISQAFYVFCEYMTSRRVQAGVSLLKFVQCVRECVCLFLSFVFCVCRCLLRVCILRLYLCTLYVRDHVSFALVRLCVDALCACASI